MRSAFAVAIALTALSARAQAPAEPDAGEMPLTLPEPPAIDDTGLQPPPKAPRTVPSWDEALAWVRAQSPDYRFNQDAVLRAEAQVRLALSNVLPSVSAQGTFAHQFITVEQNLGSGLAPYPPQDVWSLNGLANWAVLSPRGIYGIGTARVAADAAERDFAEHRRVIATALVSTMLGTLAAERAAELNRAGLKGALERLSLAEAKVRFGSGTDLDVDRAKQDVAAARSGVVTGDEALRRSREALGLALGSPQPVAAPGDLDLDQFEKSVAATCSLSNDLENRPDIAGARARVRVAERTVNDVWLQFAPSLSIQAQLSLNSQVVFGPTNTAWAGPALSVPLWDGGARYAYLRDARAALDQAKQTLAHTRIQALVDVQQAVRAVSVARASRDLAQEQRDLAQRVDARTREGYLHGLGTSLDLVIAAQGLRAAELNLALLRFQAAQARAQAALANADCGF